MNKKSDKMKSAEENNCMNRILVGDDNRSAK